VPRQEIRAGSRVPRQRLAAGSGLRPPCRSRTAGRLPGGSRSFVRDWLDTLVELIDACEFAPKTVNNARTYLSVVLNEAVLCGHLVRNAFEARDPARPRGVVSPRTRYADQPDDLAGSEEPNVRMIRTVHIAQAADEALRAIEIGGRLRAA
jgi:hypothetical protein